MPKKIINAFTLVELIVVIVILAILATIAFLSFNSYSSSSRDSVRLSDINSLNKSLELFNINASKYPDPTNVYTRVVYSGGVIFEQGNAGDSVLTAIQKVNKKPIDPLDSSEYTYSTNLNRTSFQLKGELENKLSTGFHPVDNNTVVGNLDGIEILNKINADSNSGSRICYVKGNFNGLIEKTNTGNTNYILAVPGLIVNEKNNLNLDYNTLSGKVVCNGMNNPCIVTYNPMPVFIGSGNSVPTTSEDIEDIMINLQSAYSGSNSTSTNPTISNLLNSTGTALVSLGSSVVSKVGISSVSNIVVTPASSCSGSISDSNGISTATGEVSGVSWHYSGTPGVCSWNCKSGYSWDGGSNSCVINCTNLDNSIGNNGDITTCYDNRIYSMQGGATHNKIYDLLKIEGKWWFNENIAYPLESGFKLSTWTISSNLSYSCPGNNGTTTSNCNLVSNIGYFYQWSAAMNGATSTNNQSARKQGVCPNGWAIPTKSDFTSISNSYWPTNDSELNGNIIGWHNTTSGNRDSDSVGTFEGRDSWECYWTSYQSDTNISWYTCPSLNTTKAKRSTVLKYRAYPVRCIKN